MKTPEFQIYQCQNPDCHFRCPNDLTLREIKRCPVCGGAFLPQGEPFTNFQPSPSQVAKRKVEIEVVLDNLRSTLNVGSIFRTADGAGVKHIHCCGTCPTPEHPKIKKSGLGAEELIAWSYHPNALDLVSRLKDDGKQIVCLEATPSSKPIFSTSIGSLQKIILVMGNEISGIDPAILSIADTVLDIPMAGRKTSINVAVAFGVAVYTLLNN